VTIAPEGRKLLRLEVRNAETPIEKKPAWIKTRARMGPEYTELKALVKREGLLQFAADVVKMARLDAGRGRARVAVHGVAAP